MLSATEIVAFLAASLVLILSPMTEAATINAASCAITDVTTALTAASDGDTVQIPAGRCSWTSTLKITKGVTLAGAGIDQTIIQDNVPRTNPNFGIVIAAGPSSMWRLTGFTITAGSVTDIAGAGTIQLSGSSHSFRVDHVKINDTYTYHHISMWSDLWGVIDHSQFVTTRNAVGIFVRHDSWGGVGANGDNSWASPTNLGTPQFVFIEDNTFSSTGAVQDAVDSLHGARFVARYNTTTNMTIGGGHGTDSGQRARSTRAFEIYNNKMVATSVWAEASTLRGGTGVIYSNTLTNFNIAVGAKNYRDVDAFSPWGAADGSSPFDNNTGDVYASGKHTSSNGTSLVLTDATKSWTPNQWVGYSLRNATQGWGSAIVSNTATTITVYSSNYGAGRTWNNGDAYQILSTYPALDQVGNGPGALLSGDSPMASWPRQSSEPVYVWNNTGYGIAQAGAQWAHVRIGRDVLLSSKPGYTPYVYPHPLVSGSAQKTPTGFTVK
jgi:hypothetical protein